MGTGVTLMGLQRHFATSMLSQMTPAEAVQQAAYTGNEAALMGLLAQINPGSPCCNEAVMSAIKESHWNSAMILMQNLSENHQLSFQTYNFAMITAVQKSLEAYIEELLRIDVNHCLYESVVETVKTGNEHILLVLLASGNLDLHKRAKAALHAAHQNNIRMVDILLRGILSYQFPQRGLPLTKALKENNLSFVIEQLQVYIDRTKAYTDGPAWLQCVTRFLKKLSHMIWRIEVLDIPSKNNNSFHE